MWTSVTEALRSGVNPYTLYGKLVHPPFGMQLVYLTDRIAESMGISFATTAVFLLNLVELLVAASCYAILRSAAYAPRSAFLIVLIGLSLQPAAILHTCQHVQIDVIVGLFVLLATAALARYVATCDLMNWVGGCFWLGLGILAKTVPLILLPLLLVGRRSLPWRGILLGFAIAMLPVVLGMSIIYVLNPQAVTENVLRYRSFSGNYGISGLLEQWNWAKQSGFEGDVRRVFPAVALLMMAAAAIFVLRHSSWAALAEGRWIYLLAMLLLLAVPTMGPGYAPQYVYWWWPLLVITATMFGRRYLFASCIVWLVTGLTYIAEYGLLPSHGALFLQFNQATWDRWFESADWLAAPRRQTILRLPLFVAHVAMLVIGITELRRAVGAAEVGRN